MSCVFVGVQITESPLVGGADFVRNSVSLGSIGAPSLQKLQQLQQQLSTNSSLAAEAGEQDEFEQLYSSSLPNLWDGGSSSPGSSAEAGIGSRPRETSRPDLLAVTGPNASGKSCFLRQIALIQILAQVRESPHDD